MIVLTVMAINPAQNAALTHLIAFRRICGCITASARQMLGNVPLGSEKDTT